MNWSAGGAKRQPAVQSGGAEAGLEKQHLNISWLQPVSCFIKSSIRAGPSQQQLFPACAHVSGRALKGNL